jgi:hypothetical protein
MQRLRLRARRAGFTAAIATIALLILASIAQSATGVKFTGHTSQRCLSHEGGCKGDETLGFTLSGGQVRGFHYTIQDRCPDGHTLLVTARKYPAMAVVNSRFGGTFTPIPHFAGENSVIKGKVTGKRVSGSINDTSRSPREHRLCHGRTTFTAGGK